jgi:ATP-dependent Clp protease ATP-binding subunit ClpB
MRRTIQRLIQDPLALKLISGDFHDGETIVADAAPDGTLTFTTAVEVTQSCANRGQT